MARATILIECGMTSGLGRVRRSLTLAAALEKQGMDICVVLSDTEGASLVADLGFTASLTLPSDLSGDLLVVDTCSQTADEIEAICAAAHTSIVIDDLAERPVCCDYLINPNVYAKVLDYSAYSVKRLFLGTDFTLVESRFHAAGNATGARTGTVVSFGGTDNGSLALPVVEELLKQSDMPVFIPLPDYIEPDTAMAALAETSEMVHLIRGADMAALLGGTKVFVGAAGATVLEALAAGCRVCVTATQPDQHLNVMHLPDVGVVALPTYQPAVLAQKAVSEAGAPQLSASLNPHAARDIAAVIMSYAS